MPETLLKRISQAARRARVIHILLILFPTVLTTSVGILSLALMEGSKDVIIGVLTIVFAVAVLIGAIIALYITSKTARLARRQTTFLANVSHELRSPVAIIKLHTQTLSNPRISDPKFKENREMCISYIIEATNRLDTLIQQILQWKRITAKADIIEPKPTNANLPLEHALKVFASTRLPFIGTLETQLTTTPPTLPLDTAALERALHNLLDNAYKYSGKNRHIQVRTREVRDKKNQAYFEYSITDNGIGIESHCLQTIFDEFFRASQNLHGAAGIGLGLGIVRSITEAHGGYVDVQSEYGRGSTFSIRIPLSLSSSK